MHAFDQRLLQRARPVRRLLAADVILGAGASALVLVQATLLASIVAKAFEGASLREVAPSLGLLALTFTGRAVLAWGFEIAGRRAASSVLSQLRLALVERRLRDQPASLDGTESGEIGRASCRERVFGYV